MNYNRIVFLTIFIFAGCVSDNQIAIDIDNNGTEDIIKLNGKKEPWGIEFNINGFNGSYKVEDCNMKELPVKLLRKNRIKSNYLLLINLRNKNYILTYQPCEFDEYKLLEISNNKVTETNRFYGEIVEITDLNNDGIDDIVLKDNLTNPNYNKDFVIYNYPLFHVFTLEKERIVENPNISRKYNLENNIEFEKYEKMKKPVLKLIGEMKYELIDLK